MIKPTILAGAVVAGLLSALPARADVVTFAQVSGWEAYGEVASDGQRVCGVSTRGGGRWIGIKYYHGDSGLTVQLSKNTWQLASGMRTRVTVQFDDESPWSAMAKGFLNDGTAFLELDLPRANVELFLREFKDGDRMYVRFPNESRIDDWQVDLEGSTEIAGKLFECIAAMGE